MNNFDKDIKFKLFRTVKEILHPTISKMNISNYIIELEEYLYPIRVFYPNKISDINKIIIYIHGNCNNTYTKICEELSINTNTLLIAVDYKEEDNIINNMYLNILYLYNELIDNGVDKDNIILMGDSNGGYICNEINKLSIKNKDLNINKQVLFYPKLEDDEEVNINTLILISKTDKYNKICKSFINKLKDINKSNLVEFSFVNHGFLKDMEKDTERDIYNNINSFI